MLDNILKSVINEFTDISDSVMTGVNRLMEKEIKIGVTGLSRGGKTAFITSLVNTVLSFGAEGTAQKLARFTSYETSGIYHGQIVSNHDLTVPTFPYRECLDSLTATHSKWPLPTDNISEIRLEIKFNDDRLLIPGDRRSLFIDIWDYPGEWLMDLMLLKMNYEEFSKKMKSQVEKLRNIIESSEKLIREGESLRPNEPLEYRTLKNIVSIYVDWLKECKEKGFALVVPGRFVLPGNLAGAPIIEFVPWLWDDVDSPSRDGLYSVMKERYESYRREIVEKFYNNSFSKLDRQIVLIDCFKALRGGKETFDNINDTFETLLDNFDYGSNNLLTRLFSPNIDKVIFAATKADQITYDEHKNLLSLLKSMVTQASSKVRGEGVNCQFLVLSSIAASICKQIKYEGRDIQVLSTGYEDENSYYPGEIPSKWARESMEEYQKYFKFKELRPPLIQPGESIPNINMDIMLQYILGDKL